MDARRRQRAPNDELYVISSNSPAMGDRNVLVDSASLLALAPAQLETNRPGCYRLLGAILKDEDEATMKRG